MPFKRANVKTFGFFLVFSAIIWLMVQLSKEYTQVVRIPIKYVNIPLDKSISDQRPEYLNLRLQDKGFVIIWNYRIFKPELRVNMSAAKERDGKLVYIISEHRDTIAEQLGIDFEKSRFLKDEIAIDFQMKKEKKIRVIPKFQLSYAIGYSAGENISLKPDSIKVSGPEKIIDTLQAVKTKELKVEGIHSNIAGEVELDTSNMGMLTFYQNKVHYSQRVEKFTEGKMKIEVEVLNVPENINLVIFPKEVMVYYQVNLKEYEMVEPSDFRVVCDYNSLEPGDNYLLAEIVEKPEFVTNLRLNERKIEFVIKR